MSHDQPIVDVSADAARRSRLLGIKLRALVREHLSDELVPDPVAFAPGSALIHRGEAWVYLDDNPTSRLGAALAWAMRAGAAAVNAITESGSGVLARRASQFATPISVWHVDERMLWPAVAEPFAAVAPPPPEHMAFWDLIESSGAQPAVEHGVLAGEVRGLEVCRVVDDPAAGEARLDVGIGHHDRDAFAMIHGAVPTPESLARVVAAVEQERRIDAPPHPFNRLARERLLRWAVIQDPALIGAVELPPGEPPVPRVNLKDAVPCVAVGADEQGQPIVAVCSVGVDLDLIPYAADARLAAEAADPGVAGVSSRLVVITPPRDRIKVTKELAERLDRPCEFASL
jgi:hypothetical protein